MGSEHYVGREAAATKLGQVLTGEQHRQGRKLVVQSVEGPGGIGKTALFDYVAGKIDLSSRKFLTIRISGNEDAALSTFRAVRHMIDTAVTAAPLRKPVHHYFAAFHQVEAAYEHIRREAVTELAAEGGVSADVLLGVLDKAVAVGKPLNDLFPATKSVMDVSALEKKVAENRDAIARLISGSATLSKEAAGWWSKLGVGGRAATRNAVRENALVPLAEALVKDLTAVLAGYASKDVLKPSPSKVANVDRLLLIVDDYETTQHALGDLLVMHLLPALQKAPFETTAIILGRDQLQATHVSWSQHLEACLTGPLRLDPLARTEMNALLKMHGVTTEAEQNRAWADTLGYPFNVLLWIEEVEGGGRTALMLKRFHDRTTRWMTDEQKRWLYHTLFLPEVDKRSLRQALGDEDEALRANAWFQKEGSVRDPHAPVFRVREYLRSRLEDYVRISDPDQYEALRKLGTHASALA